MQSAEVSVTDEELTAALRHDDGRARARLIPWQRAFCDALQWHHGVVTLACSTVRVSRATAYRARRDCLEFAAAWDEAVGIGRDLETAGLFHAAVEGDFEPIHEGKVLVGYWRRKSVEANIELFRRAKKREKRRPEQLGQPVVNVLLPSAEQVAGLMARLFGTAGEPADAADAAKQAVGAVAG